MKTCGIIGGIGPESTIDYYRSIIARFRQEKPDGSYPSLVINSIDVTKILGLMAGDDLEGLARYLTAEVGRLARAGADFGVLAANTPHIVFDRLARESPIPLLSIVEATRQVVERSQIGRVALFGTRFTMQARFYPDAFAGSEVALIVPDDAEQATIHDVYMNELLKGVFLPDTLRRMLRIVETMRHRDGIGGVILGGTELPLLLKDPSHDGVTFFDTTSIHVDRIVAELLAS